MKKLITPSDEQKAAYQKDLRDMNLLKKALDGKYKQFILLAFENCETKCFCQLSLEIMQGNGKAISRTTLAKNLKSHVKNCFLILVESPVSSEQKDYKCTPHGRQAIKYIRSHADFASLHHHHLEQLKK